MKPTNELWNEIGKDDVDADCEKIVFGVMFIFSAFFVAIATWLFGLIPD